MSTGAATNGKIRIAMVADSPETRALAIACSRSPLLVYPFAIFASFDDARTWLKLPAAPAPAA